jgi:hypothetical protein
MNTFGDMKSKKKIKIPKRIKKIEIHDFVELQDTLMDHDIPMASSINQAMISLIQYYDPQGYDEIYIVLNKPVVPQSYYANGVIWGKLISHSLDIPFVRSYINPKEETLTIYAGHNHIEPNFYKRLQSRLKSEKIIILPLQVVPRAYQVNPYILVTRLKKKNILIRVDQSPTQLTIRNLQ